MKEKNTAKWISYPTSVNKDTSGLSLDEMMAMLDGIAVPENATALGEIKGLYAAHKLAPSGVLLEAIIGKCLSIILGAGTMQQSINLSTPVRLIRSQPASMEWEWVQGFEHFLMLRGISETTRSVYIRALKRVMKKHGIDVNDLRESIDSYIREYEGCDRESHNVHIGSLRQFKEYMNDECGYFISIENNGYEEIASRIYCTRELAEQQLEDVISEYGASSEKIRLYDKFAVLIREYKA